MCGAIELGPPRWGWDLLFGRRLPRALPWAGVGPARWALGICGCLFGRGFPGRCPGLTWGRPCWACGICGCLFGRVFPGRCPGLTWGRPRWACGICECLFGGVFPGRCPGLAWCRPCWAWVNCWAWVICWSVGLVVGANKKPSFLGNEGFSGNSQFCVICVWLRNRLDYIGPSLAIKSALRLL